MRDALDVVDTSLAEAGIKTRITPHSPHLVAGHVPFRGYDLGVE